MGVMMQAGQLYCLILPPGQCASSPNVAKYAAQQQKSNLPEVECKPIAAPIAKGYLNPNIAR